MAWHYFVQNGVVTDEVEAYWAISTFYIFNVFLLSVFLLLLRKFPGNSFKLIGTSIINEKIYVIIKLVHTSFSNHHNN